MCCQTKQHSYLYSCQVCIPRLPRYLRDPCLTNLQKMKFSMSKPNQRNKQTNKPNKQKTGTQEQEGNAGTEISTSSVQEPDIRPASDRSWVMEMVHQIASLHSTLSSTSGCSVHPDAHISPHQQPDQLLPKADE